MSQSVDSPTCVVMRESGASLRTTDRALLFGRRADCDLVLADASASQIQAMVNPTPVGFELLAIGRNPTRVNGHPVAARVLLQDNDLLEMPGGRFRVRIQPGPNTATGAWSVLHPDGYRYALRQFPFTLGGDRGDRLLVPGWPPGAVRLHVAQGVLLLEACVPLRLEGLPLTPGTLEGVESGDTLAIDGVGVQLLHGDSARGNSTIIAVGLPLPGAVHFSFLPTGGRLEVRFEGSTAPRAIELSELRARLVAALLQPPGGYRAGDHVPDEVLAPAIWPGQADRGRTELNLLIHRTRRDLIKADINPAFLIERGAKGGSTRFRLAPGADVRVE